MQKKYWAQVALLLASLLPGAGCVDEQKTVPTELLGSWTTSHPLYADRYMDFSLDRVFFGTGEDRPSANRVLRVRSDQRENFTLIQIDYLSDEEAESTLSLQFYPGSSELRLANRDEVVWRRNISGATVSEARSTDGA